MCDHGFESYSCSSVTSEEVARRNKVVTDFHRLQMSLELIRELEGEQSRRSHEKTTFLEPLFRRQLVASGLKSAAIGEIS